MFNKIIKKIEKVANMVLKLLTPAIAIYNIFKGDTNR